MTRCSRGKHFASFWRMTWRGRNKSGDRAPDLKASDSILLKATYFAAGKPGPASCSSVRATAHTHLGTTWPAGGRWNQHACSRRSRLRRKRRLTRRRLGEEARRPGNCLPVLDLAAGFPTPAATAPSSSRLIRICPASSPSGLSPRSSKLQGTLLPIHWQPPPSSISSQCPAKTPGQTAVDRSPKKRS
jgi:hypothetical protein